MNVATELTLARRRAGLTQAQLARRAGSSQTAISAYEAGAKLPSTVTLGRLLGAAGLRLAVAVARPALCTPDAAEIARRGRELVQVLELAAALPVRHADAIGFPSLAPASRRR